MSGHAPVKPEWEDRPHGTAAAAVNYSKRKNACVLLRLQHRVHAAKQHTSYVYPCASITVPKERSIPTAWWGENIQDQERRSVDMETKERIREILLELHDDVDYDREDCLVGGKILDSFDLVTLVAELGQEFGIDITAEDFVPENFNSLDALAAMAERLMEG